MDIILQDEVNCRLNPLPPEIYRELDKKLRIFLPYARYSPQYKLGLWNGYKSFINPGGYTYINLLDEILPVLQQHNIPINLVNNRKNTIKFKFDHIDENFLSEYKWPKGHRLEGQPIHLEEHQVRAINSLLDNPQSVLEAATSAGKTIIFSAICKVVEQYGKILLLVPSSDLVIQTYEEAKIIGLDVGRLMGAKYREIDHQIIIATWQTIMHTESQAKGIAKGNYDISSDMEKLRKEELEELLDGLVCVIADECHDLTGNEIFKQFTNIFKDIPIRWGMTGTVPKKNFEQINLRLSIGPVVEHIKSKELQDKNFLAKSNITIIKLQDDFNPNKGLTLLEKKNHKGWTIERDYLKSNPKRIEFISNLIKTISQNGNTLVLVTSIDMGKSINDYLISSNIDSVFLSGSDSNVKRKEEYDTIKVEDNKVIVATQQIASTGISLPRLFNLVFVDFGLAYTKTMQSIGRGLRLAKDKTSVEIYDISSDIGSSKKHLKQRIDYYKENEHPYKIIDVKDWKK